ncbi:MAG TPA: MaoC/PaaZ C-terminal domain-containing protein [Vicinamibacterales bacterium]|nr:MaoC/PaaZ C-terminal domain-containing protein [Vicinamibacterales bacterium]
MGLCFEDFTPGRRFETPGRTVSDEDVVAFAELSGDRNPLHLDDTYARTTPFGGRIAHGALGLAVATGLFSQLGITTGTLVALAGVEWNFRAPIRPGDTVRLRLRVAEQRPLQRTDRGLVRFAAELVNQSDEVVQEGVLTELIRTRPVPNA